MSFESTDAAAKAEIQRSTTFPIDDSLVNITDPEKLELADWIRGKHTLETLSCEATLQRSASKWREGTNAWLYEDETFSKWLASRRANVNENAIFLTAGPGCGKTVLASALAQRLRKQGKTVIITYYDFKNKEKRTAISALRSLAIDLLRNAEYIPDKVLREHKNAVLGDNHVIDDHDLYTIVQVIRHLIGAFPELHIFVDGLDECRQRQALGTLLQPLFKADVDGTVKWFITTRADHDVTTMLTRCGAREIKAANAAITKDIIDYLNTTFKDLAAEIGFSGYDTSLDKLFSDLESDGVPIDSNFVWAAGIKDLLRAGVYEGEEGLVAAMADLPRGMRDLYIHSLKRLKALDKQSKTPLARKMLSYIIAAEQPLRLSELSHALAAGPGGKDFRADKIRSFDKIKALGVGLVSFGEVNGGTAEDPVVTFEHLTIYDFLTDARHSKIVKDVQEYFIPYEVAQEELGLACLHYLSYRRYRTLESAKKILGHPDHAFLKYAAAYWHHHLDVRSPTADLQFTVETFVDSPNFWTCAAVQSVVAPYAWARFEPWNNEYAPICGNVLPPPDLNVVHFGIPLPEFVKHEGARFIAQFAQQWHHVLNNCEDELYQCRMDTAWENERPDHQEWLMSQSQRSITFAGNNPGLDTSKTDLLKYMPARFCCVLRQTTGRVIHFQRDLTTGVFDQQPCKHCALATPDAQLEVQAVSAWSNTDMDEEDRAMALIRNHSQDTGITIDKEWSIACHTSNITLMDDPSRTPALAVQWYKKLEPTDDKIDMGLGQDDGTVKTYEHMLFFARRGCNPTVHLWTSKYQGHMVSCAFFPSKPWILWTSDIGQLCILRRDEIETVKHDEPQEMLEHIERAARVYREITLSKDGKRMWYVSFSTRVENLSFVHNLAVAAFQLSVTETTTKLVRTGSQTIQYSTFGWLKWPGIKTSLNDHFGIVALPPLGSRPRILRFSLTTDNVELETLQQPILFPATVPSRNPSIDYLLREGEPDVLALSLSAEVLMSSPSIVSPEHGSCQCHSHESKPLLQGPTTIAWHLHRVNDWLPWDQGRDGSSEEYVASTKLRNVRGNYIDQDKSFRVSIRSGINWTKQATLTCRT